MGRAIGIDLGTTNSCAAVIENNKPTIIMYRAGSYTIPSLFAIDEGGRELVGHEAKEQAALNPQDTVFAAKRMVGRDFHSPQVEKLRQLFTYDMMEGDQGEVIVKVKDKTFDLKEISAAILKKIRNVAEEYLDDQVTNAVITVPAYFNDRQRQAVRSAGKLAGLNVLRVLNEPTSAALAYGLGKNLRQRLAVYDLGGGTFDISIIEIRDKVFEVIASGGDTYLGGIDFDDRIIGHVIEAFGNEHGIDLSTDRIAIQRIREAAERAKITLSTTQQANIEVPFIARGPNGILNLEHVLARDQLEALVDDLVKRTVSACESIFKDAGLGPETIDEVLIVGGQSRMPLVLSRVKTYFQKEPCKGVHPDEAVAVGAAIMAHSLTSNMGEQVTLLDVLPMAIGIAKGDGSFLPLFPRNCPIPHGRKLTLTNSKDDQKSIMLRVFQGDEKLAADNELLGTFVFSGMRQGPRGSVRVQTWLNVDSEGILSVSAKDKDTEEPLDVKLKLRQQDLAPNLSIQTTTAGDDAPATRRTAPPPPSTEDTGPSAADSKSDSSPTPQAPTDDAKTSPARFGSIAGDDSDAPTPPPSEESPTAHATNKDEASDSTQESSPSSGVVSRASDQTDSAGPPAAPAETKVTPADEPGCLSLLLPWNWFR